VVAMTSRIARVSGFMSICGLADYAEAAPNGAPSRPAM
jgi:hypothetical protein